MGDETPLSEVEAASRRLSVAIDRLESVLAEAPGPAVAGERDSLRDELATLRARYDELAKITETVSAGLDSSISHIKAMLGG